MEFILVVKQKQWPYTVEVKKKFPKMFTVQPLNVVPTAERYSGNGKRRSTVPFSARACHAHFSLATPIRYPEVAKLVSTLHKPWQRPTAPKALKKSRWFDTIVPSLAATPRYCLRGSIVAGVLRAHCGLRSVIMNG